MGQLYVVSQNREPQLPASRRITFHADDGVRPRATSLAPTVIDDLFVKAVEDSVQALDFSFGAEELNVSCDGRIVRTLSPTLGESVVRRLRLLAGLLIRPTEHKGNGTIVATVDGRDYRWTLRSLDGPWGRTLRVSMGDALASQQRDLHRRIAV
jgi:hypothetical protein